jgi:hypothetical protein
MRQNGGEVAQGVETVSLWTQWEAWARLPHHSHAGNVFGALDSRCRSCAPLIRKLIWRRT